MNVTQPGHQWYQNCRGHGLRGLEPVHGFTGDADVLREIGKKWGVEALHETAGELHKNQKDQDRSDGTLTLYPTVVRLWHNLALCI